MAGSAAATTPSTVGASDMARIRVFTRQAEGPRTRMLGLIPRGALDELRRRYAQASRALGGRCQLSARVKRLEVVRVELEGEPGLVEGRRVVLELSPAPPAHHLGTRTRVFQEEIHALVKTPAPIVEPQRAVELAKG